MSYWCECYKCGGQVVSGATWYRHKKLEKMRRDMKRLKKAGPSTRAPSSPMRASSPPSDVYVKELTPEDRWDKVKIGLDSVSTRR